MSLSMIFNPNFVKGMGFDAVEEIRQISEQILLELN